MSHITSRFKSKKDFKTAAEANPDGVYLDDPSIVGAVSGSVTLILEKKGTFTVTNHPKRSWFAEVHRDRNGRVRVS